VALIILGIDGGLAALGFAVVDVGRSEVLASGVLKTAKETVKRKLHVGSDDARRIDQLSDGIVALYRTWAPELLAYELPSGAKSARAAHALGIAHALVRVSARRADVRMPIVEVTVGDARKACCPGVGRVSEEDAHAALADMFTLVLSRYQTHELDAIAVAVAASRSEVAAALSQRGAA
jgi:Holliday junction resolvasome RuvABC endonuclease subunit